MPEKISILKESGETLSSNVVSVFLIPDTQKRYIITTENAVDPHGLTVLHVSEIVDGTLQKVATDEEWSSIKTIMRAIISGNVGTFKYLPTIESIKASGQYSRDISVSASASKQMCDNYAVGDKSSATDSNLVGTEVSGGGTIAPSGMNQSIMPTQEQVIQPSSIFPAATAVAQDNELIPGIAEVPNNGGVMPQGPVVQPMGGVQNNMAMPPVENNVFNQPIAPMPMNGSENVGLNNLSQNQEVPLNPAIGLVNNTMGMDRSGVQVALGNQTVPTAQIAQEAQMPAGNEINFDSTAVPSFAPNATLDEVVAGAQAMFMEGVKNLVQTIQEKVYRDLYAKEAELKNKEAELEAREKMLNGQSMMSGSSVATPNMGISPTPSPISVTVSPLEQPVVQPFDTTSQMMNNSLPTQPPMNQQVMMGQSPMQMNGVVQNQPMGVGIPPVVNGPVAVSANNDVI